MAKQTRSQSMGGRLVRNVTSLILGEDKKARPRRSAGTRKRSSSTKSKMRTSRARSASPTRRSAGKAKRRSRGAR
jgi:hypothetical protein